MRLRHVRIVIAVAFGLMLTLLTAGYAAAQPNDDIQARAAELERDLAASNEWVGALGEQLAQAQQRVDAAEAKVAEAEARVKITRTRSLVSSR
jgi:multidrug resistance efflux pump